ncbi:hypothetical protein C8Q80DRAFT_1344961 [Daedaleopsis nitida]|nr:hypothetical protein C8Q80DRAFT_1344961 [Daedaleopsis nitida]
MATASIGHTSTVDMPHRLQRFRLVRMGVVKLTRIALAQLAFNSPQCLAVFINRLSVRRRPRFGYTPGQVEQPGLRYGDGRANTYVDNTAPHAHLYVLSLLCQTAYTASSVVGRRGLSLRISIQDRFCPLPQSYRSRSHDARQTWYLVLYRSLVGANAVSFSGSINVMLELNWWLQIVDMRDSVRPLVLAELPS